MKRPASTEMFVQDSAGMDRPSPGEVRLLLEQTSHAYKARDREAPLFTLEATSLAAHQRELVAILGPNASGKSTLLRLMAGALVPLSGRVQLDGFEVSQLDPRTRAQRIALVHQESPLLFPVRVWEYVMQGRHPYGRGLRFESPQDLEIADDALEQVGATHLKERWMHEISGGEKQRAVLARALAQQPLLLLLDEPTLHLDIGAQVELLRTLRRLAESNRFTAVVVTHELNLAAEFADHVVLLHRGKSVRVGSPGQVYERALLEQVFGTALEVERSDEGMPRVRVRGRI